MLTEKSIALVDDLINGCKTTLEIKSFHMCNRLNCKLLNFLNNAQDIRAKFTLLYLQVLRKILQDFLSTYAREHIGERVRQEVVVDLFQPTLIKVAILILWAFSKEVCSDRVLPISLK